MGKFFKSVLSNFVAGLLLLGVPPIVVAYLGYLQSIPWYLMALAIMAAPGIVIWSYLQVKTYYRLRTQTVERSGQIIRKWVEHTLLSVANSPIPEAFYRYMLSKGPYSVSVSRLKDDPEFVHIGISKNIPEAIYKTLDSVTGAKESTLIKDLRIEFARLGIQCSGLKHPLRTISFSDSIVFDQHLTRPAFVEKVLFMFRAQVLLSEFINSAIQSAPDTSNAKTTEA